MTIYIITYCSEPDHMFVSVKSKNDLAGAIFGT